MTREEAIEFGNMWLQVNEDRKDSITYAFFQMAIQALELVKIGVVKDCESCKAHCKESLAEKFLDCIVPIEREGEE